MAVQCKRWAKPVGVEAVRELFGTIVGEEVECGVLASVSGFTSGAQKFARDKPIDLLGLDEILVMVARGQDREARNEKARR